MSTGQQPVSPKNIHPRILAVVPMIGSGTSLAPRRPLYAPHGKNSKSNEILSFTSHLSDDGKFAIVEIEGRNRAAFKDILADKRTDIKVFEKGKDRQEDIEAEFRKHKKDFKLSQLEGGR